MGRLAPDAPTHLLLNRGTADIRSNIGIKLAQLYDFYMLRLLENVNIKQGGISCAWTYTFGTRRVRCSGCGSCGDSHRLGTHASTPATHVIVAQVILTIALVIGSIMPDLEQPDSLMAHKVEVLGRIARSGRLRHRRVPVHPRDDQTALERSSDWTHPRICVTHGS